MTRTENYADVITNTTAMVKLRDYLHAPNSWKGDRDSLLAELAKT